MTDITKKLVFLALKAALVVLFVLPAVASPLPGLTGMVHFAPSTLKLQRVIARFRNESREAREFRVGGNRFVLEGKATMETLVTIGSEVRVNDATIATITPQTVLAEIVIQ